MNEKNKRENKMYFISQNEYIYFPFTNINYNYNSIKRFGNQLICLNSKRTEVIRDGQW